MNVTLKQELCEIVREVIEESLPDAAVRRALGDIPPRVERRSWSR